MLLIRPTRSLARRLGVSLPTEDADRPSLLTEWYANDFRLGRGEFVLFLSPGTCVPLVIKAAPYRDLPMRFHLQLLEYLQWLGWADAPRILGPQLAVGVQYARTQDRSALGVIVEFVKHLEVDHEIGRLDLNATLKMSRRLADILVGARGYQTPVEMFRKAVGIAPQPRKTHLRLLN